MRCLYNCEKSPSEKINRSHLLRVLRENAYNAPVQVDIVPYVAGQKRGKPVSIYLTRRSLTNLKRVTFQFIGENNDNNSFGVSKEDVVVFQPVTPEDIEMSELLDNADLSDLKEIADILDVQFQHDCKAEELKVYPNELENEVNFKDIIERIEANDDQLSDVNLNNIKSFTFEQWRRLFKALEEINTNVQTLSAANCDLNDNVGILVIQCLRKNSSLKHLTLDSNMLSPKILQGILATLPMNKSLAGLRINNQVKSNQIWFLKIAKKSVSARMQETWPSSGARDC